MHHSALRYWSCITLSALVNGYYVFNATLLQKKNFVVQEPLTRYYFIEPITHVKLANNKKLIVYRVFITLNCQPIKIKCLKTTFSIFQLQIPTPLINCLLHSFTFHMIILYIANTSNLHILYMPSSSNF
jgi:hypothetical protein